MSEPEIRRRKFPWGETFTEKRPANAEPPWGPQFIDPTQRDNHPKAKLTPSPNYLARSVDRPDIEQDLDSSLESMRGYHAYHAEQGRQSPVARPQSVSSDFTSVQGELFQSKPYAKGYGPERSKRVDAALQGVKGPRVTTWEKPTAEDIAANPAWGENASLRVARNSHGKVPPTLVEAIKRSNVPAEHLEGLNEVRFSEQYENPNGDGGSKAAAWHNPAERSIIVRRGQGSAPVMAHEVGHHVHNTLTNRGIDPTSERGDVELERRWHGEVGGDNTLVSGPARGNLPYTSQEQQGRAEGFADAYSHHQMGATGPSAGYGPRSFRHDGQAAYVGERMRWGQGLDQVQSSWHAHIAGRMAQLSEDQFSEHPQLPGMED